MRKQKKKRGTVLMFIGLLMIIAALGLTLYNIWDGNRAGKASQEIAEKLVAELPEATKPHVDPTKEMNTLDLDGNLYLGLLEIPSLDLELPVMSEWSYDHLRTAPCRYSGSCFENNLVIAGHNYSGHFRDLKLLDIGADVYFTTVDGEVFQYEVDNIETLNPTQIDSMITADNWDLTLFTCTVGGRSRCTVRCVEAD